MIKFRTIKSKLYFVERTKEEIEEIAIVYDYAKKNKQWADDFDGMIVSKYNSYSDFHTSSNKLLIKTQFVGEPEIDLDELINNIKQKSGSISYRSSIEYQLRKLYNNFTEIDNDVLKSRFEFVIPEKPKTFPKYNNENPFKCFTFNSPEIISVYWNGFSWMYQMKNIGHVYDYYSEEQINEFNKN